jgi:outer membrane receptor protein involved in Fe transport
MVSCERKRIFPRLFQFVALLAVLALVVPAWSQGNYGRILGVVTDQAGGAVVGASVTVLDVARGAARTLVTDSGGEYSAPGLIPGKYEVTVEAMGFTKFDRQNITVEVGQDVRADASLMVGAQTQTVTVTEEAPSITTTNAVLGAEIENRALTELPLNGRNYLHLLMDSPGVQMKPGGGPDSYTSNGNRSVANAYMIDGLFSTNENDGGSPDIGGGAGNAGPEQATLMPIDAVQEINVMEDPKAEYGYHSGAFVNIGLKSGTNDFHGTAYAYGRDSALEATNAFLTPATKQIDAVEQWGGSIGGPIKKDKIFFFSNFEHQYFTIQPAKSGAAPTTSDLGETSLASATGSLPDAIAAMNAAGVPLSQLSLNIAGCTNPSTHPTTAAGITCNVSNGLFGNLANVTSETLDFPVIGGSNNDVTKIDYTLNNTNAIHGEFLFGNGDPIAQSGTVLEPWWRGQYHIRAQVAREMWVWSPNSSWVNEARFGYDRVTQNANSGDCYPQQFGSPNYVSLGLVSGASVCGIPSISISGFTNLGTTLGATGTPTYFQGEDAVSRTVGKHILKFGGGVRSFDFLVASFGSQRGTISFASATDGAAKLTALEAFLAGIPNSSSTASSIAVGNPNENFTWWSYYGFAQDDWRITQRITLNLGLRYEYETPMRSVNNQAGGFDPTTPSGLFQQTSSRSLWSSSPNDWGPRVGVAWDVNGNGRTVVRAGGGVFYNSFAGRYIGSLAPAYLVPTGGSLHLANGSAIQGPGNMQNGTIAITPATLQTNWQLNNTVPGSPLFGSVPTTSTIACGDGLTGQPSPCSLTLNAPNLRPAMAGEWNLDIQRAITNSMTLTVGYVGNKGVNETTLEDINQPTPGVKSVTGCATCLTEQQRRPYYSQFPYLGQINEWAPIISSNYNALQASVRERVTKGFSFTAGYTWGHNLDGHSEEDGTPKNLMNSTNPQADYGDADFDYRNRFTLTGTYLLPGKKSPAQMLEGWQVNWGINVVSALVYNPYDPTSDLSGTGELADRWDIVGNIKDFSGYGQRTPMPCYGIASSTFGATPNCTSVASLAQMPAQCVSAAAGLPTNPSVPSTDPNATGLEALSNFGCYMVNGSVIVPPAQGTFGDIPRNAFRGQGEHYLDLSITKNWNIKERVTAQFRAEMFNVLNVVNYAAPANGGTTSAYASPALFGTSGGTPDVANGAPVFGTAGPRKIQLGAKFIF